VWFAGRIHKINVDTRAPVVDKVTASPDPVMFSKGQTVTITAEVRDPWPAILRDGATTKNTLDGKITVHVFKDAQKTEVLHCFDTDQPITLTWDAAKLGYCASKQYQWNGAELLSDLPHDYWIYVRVKDEAGNAGDNMDNGSIRDKASADPSFVQFDRRLPTLRRRGLAQ